MELLFKEKIIGIIKDINKEELWIHGIFEGSESFYQYKDFFQALVCEDEFEEVSFNSELLDDKNWSVRDIEDIRGIFIPAIYVDGDISFRYR